MSIAIELHNVAVAYRRKGIPLIAPSRRRWALDDVSMRVEKGETLGVIGRNGAGKSTLLRVLAGIIDPDRGHVARAPVRASLLSLQVGFLNHLSGKENAMLSGMLLGPDKRTMQSRLEAIMAFAELADFADEPLATYSAGMRARLGFSVAYHAAPDVLLIDEILGVGDLMFRKKSSQAIRSMIRSEKTVVLVSHHLSVLSELCVKTVWIERGKTRMQGPTDEVLSAYRNYMLDEDGQSAEADPSDNTA